MDNESPLLAVTNLAVNFGETKALVDVSFTIKKGEYVGLIGPNGAGKSTLLKTILRTISPQSGTIIAPPRAKIGYVPQQFLLRTPVAISVAEVLQMGFARIGFWQSRAEKEVMAEALAAVGFETDFLSKNYQTLSGGQKQRVIIARALLNNPDLLLFDEPLSGVDYATKLRIYDLLADLNQKKGITILFVSHEVDAVVSKCQRILCLDKTLHDGCHPIHFAKGEHVICQVPPLSEKLTPIHHHSHPPV